MTQSSAGTIPAGMQLYTFEYPDSADHTDREMIQCFCTTFDQAEIFGRMYGSVRVTHAISGRSRKIQQPA